MAARKISNNVPERLVLLLKEKVSSSSQSAIARESNIPLFTVQRCLKGIGDPTTDTLLRFADYLGVSVAWLRGDVEAPGAVEITATCSRCGGNVGVLPDRIVGEKSIRITVEPCPECLKTADEKELRSDSHSS